VRTKEPPKKDFEYPVYTVTVNLCGACLDGIGGECHTPGCALFLSVAPDIPIMDLCTHTHLCGDEGKPVSEKLCDGVESRHKNTKIDYATKYGLWRGKSVATEDAVKCIRDEVAYATRLANRRACRIVRKHRLDGNDGIGDFCDRIESEIRGRRR